MILTCPNCATRFFADDKAIGPAGRRVECDACGEIWSSTGDSSDRASPMAPAEKAVDAVEQVGPAEAPLFVERGSPTRKTVRKPSRAPWVIGLLIVVVLVVGMFAFQPQIERLFPGASTLYQSLGLESVDRAGR